MNRFQHLLSIAVVFGALLCGSSPTLASDTVRFVGTLQGQNGLPFEGSVDVLAELTSDAAGLTVVWGPVDVGSVDVSGGRFEIFLGDDGPALAPVVHAHSDLWVQLTLNGEVLSPPQRLVAVPYALRAGTADQVGSIPAASVATKTYASQVATAAAASASGPDKLDEVSNGTLTNEFADVLWSSNESDLIIEADANGALVKIEVSESSATQLLSLSITATLELNFANEVVMEVVPPETLDSPPIKLFEGVLNPASQAGDSTFDFEFSHTKIAGLGQLLEKSPQGPWSLIVRDIDANAPPGNKNGSLVGWQLHFDALRGDAVAANADLWVEGELSADALWVANGATITGGIQVAGVSNMQTVVASGAVTSASNISGVDINASDDISASGDVSATGAVQAGGDVEAGGDVVVGGALELGGQSRAQHSPVVAFKRDNDFNRQVLSGLASDDFIPLLSVEHERVVAGSSLYVEGMLSVAAPTGVPWGLTLRNEYLNEAGEVTFTNFTVGSFVAPDSIGSDLAEQATAIPFRFRASSTTPRMRLTVGFHRNGGASAPPYTVFNPSASDISGVGFCNSELWMWEIAD